jgi:pyruvate,water dikinase
MPSAMRPSVLWLDELRAADLPRVGGKLARLGALAGNSYRVPDGFAIPVELLAAAFPETVHREIARLVDAAPDDLEAVEAASGQIRALIDAHPLAAALGDAIDEAYAALAAKCSRGDDFPVAVRSSGISEDGAQASFAGQFDSYLGICGVAAVREHVKKCWASQYNARALHYLRRRGARPDQSGIAVGVLTMIESQAAGIGFSINPITGNRGQLVIEGSFGLGDAIVSGAVTPDRWLVDKASLAVVEEHIAEKMTRTVFRADRRAAVNEAVPDHLRRTPCLTREQIAELARVLVAIERQEGTPQDIEWTFDAGEPARLFLLQHRPVTAAGSGQGSEPKTEPFDPVQYTLKKVFGINPTARGVK